MHLIFFKFEFFLKRYKFGEASHVWREDVSQDQRETQYSPTLLPSPGSRALGRIMRTLGFWDEHRMDTNSITCQQDSVTGSCARTVGSFSSSGMGTQEDHVPAAAHRQRQGSGTRTKEDRVPTVPTDRGRAGELPVWEGPL